MHWLYTLLAMTYLVTTPSSERVCPSIEIGPNNLTNYKALTKCDVIAGSVTLVKIQIDNATKLVTPIREITGYLLVYRVEGIKSLSEIFPNLTVIRGRELLFQKYSLAVYENLNLKDIGLVSLRKIQTGSIRVQRNPMLCYVQTVNWMYLIENIMRQHLYLKGNKNENFCPICQSEKPTGPTFMKTHCWNLKNYQKTCPSKCGPNGCNENGDCCQPTCLYGCTKPNANNCAICKNFRNEKGICLDSCNIMTSLQVVPGNRECITHAECIKRGRIIQGASSCIQHCPLGYDEIVKDGSRRCGMNCTGHFVLHTSADIQQIHQCALINGSLTIELKEQTSNTINELEKALGSLKVITGFLQIQNSPQLISLHFLTSLDTINGNELIDNKYSFYVKNNHHLEQIWLPNQKVAILKGRLYFHFNPKLCFDNILNLTSSLKYADVISPADASQNSNGDNAICSKSPRTISPQIEDFNATAVRIRVDPVHPEDRRVLLGYLHFYKESPIQNVTMYTGFHACGHDDWKMDISLSKNIRHVISNLKPFTQYAYYVKAFTMLDYHMELESVSAIMYFRTLAFKPSPVRNVFSFSYKSTEIDLHWWPPKQPNGIIKKYILNYELTTDDSHDEINIGKSPNCTCPTKRAFRGPLPLDEDYYSKEEMIYDDLFPDLIFVSRNVVETSTLTPKLPVLAKNKRDDFWKYLADMEKESLREQDTGTGDFAIVKPKSTCPIADASPLYQIENNCREEVEYSGTEVTGKVHKYKIQGLKENSDYKISIRACGDMNIPDACGAATVVWARTASEKLAEFLKNGI